MRHTSADGKILKPSLHCFNVHVTLRVLKIYADGEKIGRFMFTANMFSARISGRTIRLICRPKRGDIVIYEKGRQISSFSKNILSHEREAFKLDEMEESGSSLPGLVRESDGELIARSNGDGSMEFHAEPDPVLLSFTAMIMCVIRVAGVPKKFSMKPEYLKVLFGSSRAAAILPLSSIMIFGTVAFLLLAGWFDAGLSGKILVTGYAVFMISIVVAIIFTQLFRKVNFPARA